MQSIFELCIPRAEVLSGDLREDLFAARLQDVIVGTADPVYGDAHIFFDNTYPTAGLKVLLSDAIGRLTGDGIGKNAVIRLETAFGGGKTHNLIALYHIAKGNTPTDIASSILPKGVRAPKINEVALAGIVGSDSDPINGNFHPIDNIRTFTLWGELAYQLGGITGYEIVKQSDISKVAPGTGVFTEILGDKPALILIDEIARALRAAKAVETANGQSDLARQTVAFLMTLLEYASSQQRVVVVLTLARESDAFGQETNDISEALSVSARQERVLTPTAETEIPAIVTHRLFKSIDRKNIKQIIDAYSAYYTQLIDKNADLPARCTRAEYLKEFEDAYPFHPELLTTLNHKTATIPNFNQTRGALRLLAMTVRSLWEKRHLKTWLIHLYNIDLGNANIVGELTTRLDRPRFMQVVEADITNVLPGSHAHAQELDNLQYLNIGKPPYTQRLATTIFIHSLTQSVASGVEPTDLFLATLTPNSCDTDDDPGVVQKALESYYKNAWFLEYDGHRYRFKTEPSLNKIIEDETANVGSSKAKAEIEQRIKQIWRKGYFQPVYFPVEVSDVEDDSDLPKLVIMHFDAVKVHTAQQELPDIIRKLYEYSGMVESFRKFQNNLLFLVPDADQVENMVAVCRRYLAIGRIIGDADRIREFTKEQREELKKSQEGYELDVRVAITKAYRYIYYPSSDALHSNSYLKRETLPPQDQGDMDKDQTNTLVRILRTLKKALTADDDTLSAMYVKSKAWEASIVSVTTEDMQKFFARKISLPFLLDPNQLKKTIMNGVKNNEWIYYNSDEEFGYDSDSPPALWQVSSGTILYTIKEALRLGIRIKGKWKPADNIFEEFCPVCHNPKSKCICDIPPSEEHEISRITGQGTVSQAFQQLLDTGQDNKILKIKSLSIKVAGSNKQSTTDMRSIGLAIPQLGKSEYRLHQHLSLSFISKKESLEWDFNGGWDRYKRLKAVTDVFAQEADEQNVEMILDISYQDCLELDSHDFQNIRDILTNLGIVKVNIEAIPFKEDKS